MVLVDGLLCCKGEVLGLPTDQEQGHEVGVAELAAGVLEKGEQLAILRIEIGSGMSRCLLWKIV